MFWYFLKYFLIVAGPVLGIVIARRGGRHGIVSSIVAGAFGGALVIGCTSVCVTLFPWIGKPGVLWGAPQVAGFISIFFIAGLYGGFWGGLIGIVVGITSWLFGKSSAPTSASPPTPDFPENSSN